MGLPVVSNTPANNLINGSTSGTQSRTPGAGETAIVWGATTVGGAGVSVSGAGGTWTQIASGGDGTRTWFVYRGTGITSGSSQTVTVSFSNTTTCRWSWAAVTGISTTTPDDQNGNKTTASSTRTSSDCVSTALTTPANIFAVAAMASSATLATITAPTSWTIVTATSNAALVLIWRVVAAGLSADSVTVTHSSTTLATTAVAATFNGDDQGGGSSSNPRHLLTLGVG